MTKKQSESFTFEQFVVFFIKKIVKENHEKKKYKNFAQMKINFTFAPGEMAERSNAAVLKTVDRVSGPGVRIPLSPPVKQFIR